MDATIAIEDVRAEIQQTSRRLHTVAHLAATPPRPWLEDGSGTVTAVLSPEDARMVGSHSPSRTGLRRVVGPAPSSPPLRADGGDDDGGGGDGPCADEGDVAVLLPLPPASTTPSLRPGTGTLAVASPRSLWRYVQSLAGETTAAAITTSSSGDGRGAHRSLPQPQAVGGASTAVAAAPPAPPLLHGLPPDYARFCREKMGPCSRRVYFPPWIQRREASWADTVHSWEAHRALWAELTQANRRRVLQLPQHELLARAAQDGPETGGVASFHMPPDCHALLTEYEQPPSLLSAVPHRRQRLRHVGVAPLWLSPRLGSPRRRRGA
jgi:hypothetical protein